MNKWVKIGLISLGGLLMLGALGLGVGAYFFSRSLDAVSRVEAAKIARTVAAGWTLDAVHAVADPELSRQVPDDTIRTVLAAFSQRLGALQSTGDESGACAKSLNIARHRLDVTAQYDVKAKFEKGEGTIKLTFAWHGGKWWLLDYYVDSPQFADLALGK